MKKLKKYCKLMKQALLIIDHGSKLKAANDMIFDVVKLVKERNKNIIVVGAHMELASPTIEDGIAECVKHGATHIIAQPFMLSPGRHSTKDIPNLVATTAKSYPTVKIETASHFGLHPKIVDVILDQFQKVSESYS
jgi:sirohydrochlorin ferrochelatase